MPENDAPPAAPGQPLSRRPAWIILAAVAVIALAVWSFRGHSSGGPGPGSVDGTAINLVTTDRDDLACASDKSFGKYRCEFKAPGVPWPDPPAPADRLAGYYTMDQKLVVVPGLFEQPALAARYAQEQPRNLTRDQRPRFSANCQLKTIDHLRDFQTRWLKGGDWNHQDDAPVAVPSGCKIQ
ncbi:MAG TPA: hypothetical protein VI456_11755 [Polyangia bacterium]